MTVETVGDVGEFGLIDRLLASLPNEVRQSADSVPTGAGDDAAVLAPPADGLQIVTTDTLVEGIHFRFDWTDWESLGHKSLAVNLSDIAAMGGIPTTAFVTLGLRGDEQASDLETMYRGMGALARRHGVVIAGGDIVRVPTSRLVSITALGVAADAGVLLRSGARPGDIIGITGAIGASAAGLEILKHPERYACRATAPQLVDAHLRPDPRIRAGQLLAELGATSAMDLSDGLAGDLPKILVASGVCAEIRIDSLPVISAVRALFADTWQQLALHGGEDYELLFTIAEGRWNDLAEAAEQDGITVTKIGSIVVRKEASSLTVFQLDGTREVITAGAFDHFSDSRQSVPDEN